MEGNEPVLEWMRPISNYFLHSAAGSERWDENIRDNWMGAVHHICYPSCYTS